MAITPSDFSKIWASNADTSEYTFSDADYLKGWDFVGNLPPTRAQWNAMQKSTDEKMKYVFDNFGAPLLANTVAEMTMQNRVYVYTGSETGYTAGHWYYWNGSAWTDGGVYNSNTVQVDPTLTISGAAADARVVGDKFADAEDEFDKYVTNKMQDHEPLNWFNPADPDVGTGYIDANGNIIESTTYSHSGYIPIKKGELLRWYYNATYLGVSNAAVYDANKTVIPSAGWTGTAVYSYLVPSNAAYIRVSYETRYQSRYQVTKNYVPTAYNTYFEPYIEITENFVTPETEKALVNSVQLQYETSPNENIVLNSDNGTGAWYASGSSMVFNASYTSFHYAVIPLEPNTDYIVNQLGNFRWWAFTKNGVVTSSGQNQTFYAFNSGENDTAYFTITNSYWSDTIDNPDGTYPFIVAKGTHGNNNHNKNLVGANGLSQNNMRGLFSVALPKRGWSLTQGIPVKLYVANILGLSKNTISLGYGSNASINDKKSITINTETASQGFNTQMYKYSVYDDNMCLVARREATSGRIFADNLQNCSVLIIGDSTVNNTAIRLNANFAARNKTVTLLGTQGTSPTQNEGRPGWSAGDYCGKSDRGKTSANAFWNPSTQAFDFSYYMTTQGYSSVDFVVVQLGTNDLYNAKIDMASVTTAWSYLKQIIDSILAYNANQKIILNLPGAINANLEAYGKYYNLINALFRKFDEYCLFQTAVQQYYSKVSCSIAHLVVDPETEINDNIHPTMEGYDKISLATLSVINIWQNW